MNLTIGFLELTLYSLDESRLAAHNFFVFYCLSLVFGEGQLHTCPIVQRKSKNVKRRLLARQSVTDSLILTFPIQCYTETAFYALKRLQTKKRKIVDRRASKSRKIR
jgi:hypothetical protein